MLNSNKLLKVTLFTLLSFISYLNVNAQVDALTNNLLIVEVVYEQNGTFYTQSSAGTVPAGLSAIGNDAINIYRITYDEDGNLGTTNDLIDVYPKADDVGFLSFAPEITGNTATSANIAVIEPNPNGLTVYDAPDGTFDNDGNDPYELAMQRITAFPDVRSYWTVNSTALGASGSGYQDFMSFLFYLRGTFDTPDETETFTEPDAVFLATERNGNSPMLFTPLGAGGSTINGANQVEIDTNADGSSNDQDYPWNTGFLNSNDNTTGQPKYLLLFSNDLFFNNNPNSAQNIYGFDVDLEFSYADGSVLAFRDPQTRITVGECWRTLSSTPITGATYAELLSNVWTQGVPGSDAPGAPSTESNVLLWDINEAGDTEAGWTTTGLDLTDEIPVGTGFLISIFADDDFDNNPDDFPKVLEVQGKENNSTVTPTLNSNADGWTLLGNPYGAPLVFSDVVGNTGTNGITEVAYVYDRNAGGNTNGNNGGWRTTNGTLAGDILNGLIAPFQGFFVQNDDNTSATVEMQLNDRGSLDFATGSLDEWEFYGKANQEQIEHIRLEVEGEQVYNSAWISLADFGSNSRIKGDAYELVPFSENYAMLSTRKDNELFDIGQFKYSESLSIPLNLETTMAGSYTIRTTRFDPESTADLVFIDTKNNVTIPFDENFEYEFEVRQASKSNPDPLQCGATAQELAAKYTPQKASPLSGDRFLIQHASISTQTGGSEQPSEFGLKQNFPNPFNPTTQITYQLPRQSDIRLEVFDMNGRQVATLVNQSMSAGTHTVNFDASDLSSGIYMYRLQAGSTVLTRKLTLVK